jgi:hypothetical protein
VVVICLLSVLVATSCCRPVDGLVLVVLVVVLGLVRVVIASSPA